MILVVGLGLRKSGLVNQNLVKIVAIKKCDLYVEDIEGLNSNSVPRPEQQVFNLMIKNGGEGTTKGLLYIFFSKELDKKCTT